MKNKVAAVLGGLLALVAVFMLSAMPSFGDDESEVGNGTGTPVEAPAGKTPGLNE